MTDTLVQPVQESLIRLSDVDSNISVQDMNYIFFYQKIIKPDAINSNLFALHYREEQQETWNTCKSLLTTEFTVVKTEDVIRHIQHNLGGNLSNERHYRSDTSVRSTFSLSGYDITLTAEPEEDLILFKILTNITADVTLLSEAKLVFNIINGFSGNHALFLTYGLLKKFNNDVSINNIFLLDKFSKRLVHDNRIVMSIEDVTNVQRSIIEQVTNFKRVSFKEDMIEKLEDMFPKKFTKRFVGLYESVPENLRNFYYCSYILSSMLDTEKKVELEIKLRGFITKNITEKLELLDA